MMIVFCCGMRRSGGTLTYQITKELVERSGTGKGHGFYPTIHWLPKLPAIDGLNVIKCHAYIDRPGKVIYNYRDIRDVAVSLMQMWSDSFDKVAYKELPVVLRNYRLWMARPDKLVLRYEAIRDDLPGLVSQIAGYLAIPLTPDECGIIAAGYGVDRQKERIAAYRYPEDRSKPEPESLLHRNHIQSGAAGRWQSELEPEQVAILHDLYGDWLATNGYDCPIG